MCAVVPSIIVTLSASSFESPDKTGEHTVSEITDPVLIEHVKALYEEGEAQ